MSRKDEVLFSIQNPSGSICLKVIMHTFRPPDTQWSQIRITLSSHVASVTTGGNTGECYSLGLFGSITYKNWVPII